VDRLGPIQEEPKPRRRSRLGDTPESLNRAGDSADEADVEDEDTCEDDVSEPTEFWWRCQHTDADADCWCTTWESLGRPAVWKGGRWI
jgi:hypothetical protein